MLHRQSVYFISKYGVMSKIAAASYFALQPAKSADSAANRPRSAPFLTAPTPHFTIHLESAVFVFHINGTTQGITGSLRAACSEPVQRFLACPFS
jgi:hypothetical protein